MARVVKISDKKHPSLDTSTSVMITHARCLTRPDDLSSRGITDSLRKIDSFADSRNEEQRL